MRSARSRAEAPWILAAPPRRVRPLSGARLPSPHDESVEVHERRADRPHRPGESPRRSRGRHRLPTLPLDLSAPAAARVRQRPLLEGALVRARRRCPKASSSRRMADVLATTRTGSSRLPRAPRLVRRSPFTAWNTAFFEDGAFVRDSRATRSSAEPIHLCSSSRKRRARSPRVSHPRILIVAEPRLAGVGRRDVRRGRDVPDERGDGDRASPTARRSSTTRSSANRSTPSTSTTIAGHRGARRAGSTSHNVALGAALARTDIGVVLDGEGARVRP